MRYSTKMLLSTASFAALMYLPTSTAEAATTAGTSIVNTASVSYQVGGVAQTAQTASNTIVVDAKIVLTDVEQGPTTSVAPGQTGAVTTFQVSNVSNETIDIGLSAAAQANGATAAHGGTVNLTATTYTYWVNTNGSTTCSYNAGNATQVTYLDEVAANASVCVYVLANIPSSATNGQVAGINLTVTAEQGGTAGSQGSVLTQSNSTVAWTPGTMQTVFGDGAGNGGDSQYDGKYTALGDYTVAAPMLTVFKNSSILSDPVNGTTNPKAIPGATMQYCIVVSNAAGAGASATNLSVSDVLPANVTYKPNSVVLNTSVTGSGSSATCGSGTAGSDATNYSASPPTVNGSLANLTAGSSEGLLFQVVIN